MIMNPNRRDFLKSAGGFEVAAVGMSGLLRAAGSSKRPNFVIIFLDDSGYADFRPFGKPDYPTPNVERLASRGCSFSNFHVPQAICSASRSALLSGCYPGRTGIVGAHSPGARGLEPKFATWGRCSRRPAIEQRHSGSGTSATSQTPARPRGDSTNRAV